MADGTHHASAAPLEVDPTLVGQLLTNTLKY